MILTLNPNVFHLSKLHPLSRPSSYFHRTRNISLTTICKLQKPENGKTIGNQSSNGNITKTISLSNAAPPVAEKTDEENSGDQVVKGGGNGGGGNGNRVGFLKRLPKKVLSVLSNLPLAITEMFTIAALMALGTVIEQGETPDFYFQKYPEDNPVLGFFTWRWIFTLGLDHLYSAPIFLGM